MNYDEKIHRLLGCKSTDSARTIAQRLAKPPVPISDGYWLSLYADTTATEDIVSSRSIALTQHTQHSLKPYMWPCLQVPHLGVQFFQILHLVKKVLQKKLALPPTPRNGQPQVGCLQLATNEASDEVLYRFNSTTV